MRVMAIDHGEKRIGVAISDVTGSIARPLTILPHRSRDADVRRILDLAERHDISAIVVGESRDEEGRRNPAGERAARFAAVLKSMTDKSVVLWDESLSTQDARKRRMERGTGRKRRPEPVDAEAAAVILQSYLDGRPSTES